MPTTQYDAALDLSLDVMRADAAARRKINRILRSLEKDLAAKLTRGTLTEWGRARVNRQLIDARKLIIQNYKDIAEISIATAEGVGQVSGSATAKALSVGAVSAVIPTNAVLDQLSRGSVIQGAAQGEWWRRQSQNTSWRYAQAVKQGIVNAETNSQIIARVRRELAVTQRSAAALVQTSMQTVMNNARTATFQTNLDIIKKFRAVTALDGHVCVQCIPLADKEWKPDGTPIGHSLPFPTYPLHFNCRCLLIAIVLDGPQGGKRASQDGPVSANLTFEKFLERKSIAAQNEVLGVGRAQLWRDGKITLQDLTTGTNQPLSLKQLREKYVS